MNGFRMTRLEKGVNGTNGKEENDRYEDDDENYLGINPIDIMMDLLKIVVNS